MSVEINGFYVHINDIFDISQEQLTPDGLTAVYNAIQTKTSEIIIAKRIQYAFEDGNGERFWENFFLCDNVHRKQGYAVIHIFTKQQLALLKAWWNYMMVTSDQTVKDNLNKSKENFFKSDPEYDTLKIGKQIKYIEPLYVYYVDNIISVNIRNLTLKRLILYKSPACEKINKNIGIEFFENDVSVDNLHDIAIADRISVLNRVFSSSIGKVKSNIGNNLSRGYELEVVMSLFLSKMDNDLRQINYCKKFMPKCSLVNKYF